MASPGLGSLPLGFGGRTSAIACAGDGLWTRPCAETVALKTVVPNIRTQKSPFASFLTLSL
jgi:hypothetical protein